MTITKDATWHQLEGRVGQLRGDLATAERKLREYAAASVAKQLGLVAGETVLVSKGKRYVYASMDMRSSSYIEWRWTIGHKCRKDGTPGRETSLYGDWQIERGEG